MIDHRVTGCSGDTLESLRLTCAGVTPDFHFRIHARSAIVSLVASPRLSRQERTHDITPDDYATVNTITEIAVSPDGKQVAYCLATWDKKADNRKTDLWVVDTDGKGKPKQLTKDRAGDRAPEVERRRQVDLRARQPRRRRRRKTQVWKVPLDGEAESR